MKNHLIQNPVLPFLLLSFIVTDASLSGKANRMRRADPPCRDGVYQGKAPGFGGDITVSVTIEKGVIESVKVISHTEDYPRDAIRVIPHDIVQAQGIERVNAVTGATVTSNGILRAVEKALEAARPPAVKADSVLMKPLHETQRKKF